MKIENILKILTCVLNSFSLTTSIIFVIFYLKSKDKKRILTNLIFYMQISDGILAFGLFLCIFPTEDNDYIELCRLQGFLIEFGAILSFFWRAGISIMLCLALKYNKNYFETHHTLFVIIVFIASILIASVPFLTENYGFTYIWCFMNYSDDYPIFILFYLILWSASIIIIFSYFSIYNFLKSVNELPEIKKFVSTIKWYPIIIFASWSFSTIETILYLVFNNCPLVIKVLHICGMSLQGSLNFFFYGYNYLKKSNNREIINPL